jgi:plastocyanin
VPVPRTLRALLCAALALAVVAPAASAADRPSDIPHVEYAGIQKYRFKFGPLTIRPGQNDIKINPASQLPTIPGYITRFKPDLIREDGTVPPVDVIHLHHAVWTTNRPQVGGSPIFAAGEEKTIVQAPRGFGYRFEPQDQWMINYMIHNLETSKETVYVTYDIDFVPDGSAGAVGMKEVRTKWLDVAGLRIYPVFNAQRKFGKDGKFTFPDDARGDERAKVGRAISWTVPGPRTIVQTAGHLHPGGLYTDLFVTRNGLTKRLFRSRAKYFEPAGPVSWDVSMTATPPEWRIKLKKGDVLSVKATYDTTDASWYEAMGIMPVEVYNGRDVGGIDPFETAPPKNGVITHGRLPENQNHGGDLTILPDARAMAAKAFTGIVDIRNFFYTRGDLNKKTSIPVIPLGSALTFKNTDAKQWIQHSITACKAPCNKRTGVAYPIPNGRVDFDSGTLGFQAPGEIGTAATGTDTWTTPSNLGSGTYTYFCRIHPFMRGAFKVAPKTKKKT